MSKNSENPTQGLLLSRVTVDTRAVSGDIELAAKVRAVLELHGELQQQAGGKSPKSIRELLEEHLSLKDGLLKSYVCGFGSHGIAVIDHFIEKQPERGQQQYQQYLENWRQKLRA